MTISKIDFSKLLKEITDISIALLAEKNYARLLDMILLKAKKITNADGGCLYIYSRYRSFIHTGVCACIVRSEE
jgi:hypothetical protein